MQQPSIDINAPKKSLLNTSIDELSELLTPNPKCRKNKVLKDITNQAQDAPTNTNATDSNPTIRNEPSIDFSEDWDELFQEEQVETGNHSDVSATDLVSADDTEILLTPCNDGSFIETPEMKKVTDKFSPASARKYTTPSQFFIEDDEKENILDFNSVVDKNVKLISAKLKKSLEYDLQKLIKTISKESILDNVSVMNNALMAERKMRLEKEAENEKLRKQIEELTRKCSESAQGVIPNDLEQRVKKLEEQLKYETKMNEKLVNERNELKSISEKNIALLEEKLKLYEQEKQKHDTSLKQTLSELSNIKKEKEALEQKLKNHDILKKKYDLQTQQLKLMKRELFKLQNANKEMKCAIQGTIKNTLISIANLQYQVLKQFQSSQAELTAIKKQYTHEMKLRKQLHDTIQQMKGNIRVFCRVRPLLPKEMELGKRFVPTFPKENTVCIRDTSNKSRERLLNFEFDKVFDHHTSQQTIFSEAAPLAISVMDGYNAAILAYGQTGSGKTYTMEGPENDRGLNFNIVRELFRVQKERHSCQYSFRVSVLEIYNDQAFDLLVDGSREQKLDVRNSGKGVVLPELVDKPVTCVEDVMKLLAIGQSNRAVGANNLNERSSRSHCILCITVEGFNIVSKEKTRGKLYLVDLAGSERMSGSLNANETKHINLSLTSLGDVMESLINKNTHIPYRNSKLTYLLQDALGNGSKTLMIINVSPTQECLQETICSLNFGTRVRRVQLGEAKRNVEQLPKLQTSQREKSVQAKERPKSYYMRGRTK